MDERISRDQMDSRELSLELLKSIREIDCRIDELKMYLDYNRPAAGEPERRTYLIQRMERLIETRFCLVYSFMDLNPSIKNETAGTQQVESTNPFENLNITYEDLRRKL